MKLFTLLLLTAMTAFGQEPKPDLAIIHAKVFNSRTGKLASNQTILVKDGIIVGVGSGSKGYPAHRVIDAGGKLVTPGFVDTHIHLTDVYRKHGPLPAHFSEDSVALYRKWLADDYLPFGVTCAMIMGQPESWLPPVLSWHHGENYPDVYTVGGALVSNQGRKPYINHVVVNSPWEAKQQVIAHYKLGLRHVKLYWKLRRGEFEAAFKTADSLGMRVYGHIDQHVMFIDSTLDIGLRNYEHILTLVNSVALNEADFNQDMQQYYGPGHGNGQVERLEMFRFVHDKNPAVLDSLIDKLGRHQATFSTSIHLMAEPFGLTYFSNQLDTTLSVAQVERCRENFKIFMGYVKQAFDKGIMLRIGTDWPNGGKAIVSEQLLLAEYGFSVAEILKISTMNGAVALGMDGEYGVIEKGRKANVLIWEKSPFDQYENFRSEKMIIKDGVVFENKN